jgi:hypothetical protein
MSQYHLRLPDPARARGDDPALSFSAHGADEFAEQLRQALAEPRLFQQWLGGQPEPDEVDPQLGAVDPAAEVEGEQADLAILLRVRTRLGSDLLRQRLRWLAGANWELRDVTR